MSRVCLAVPSLLPAEAPGRIVRGDARAVLPWLDPVTITLADPPFVWLHGLQALEAAGPDDALPVEAVYPVYAFLSQWWPLVLRRTTCAAWVVTHRLYRPFYRALTPPRVPLRAWETATPDRWLLQVGAPPLAAPSPALLAERCSGQGSAVAFWAGLLALTPGDPSGVVFDPFCGTGASLVAAAAAGYRIVGCESAPAIAARLVARLAAAGLSVPCVSGVGPTGPSQESSDGPFSA